MPALSDVHALAEIPLFRGLDDAELESINKRLNKHKFPPGTNVIAVETPGEAVYIILSGTVKIKIVDCGITGNRFAYHCHGIWLKRIHRLYGISLDDSHRFLPGKRNPPLGGCQ